MKIFQEDEEPASETRPRIQQAKSLGPKKRARSPKTTHLQAEGPQEPLVRPRRRLFKTFVASSSSSYFPLMTCM